MNCNQLRLSVCNVGGVHHLKVCVCVFVRPSFVRWMHMISVLCPIFFTWKHNSSVKVCIAASASSSCPLSPSASTYTSHGPPTSSHHTWWKNYHTSGDDDADADVCVWSMIIMVWKKNPCEGSIRPQIRMIFFTFSKPDWVLDHLTVMIINLFLTSVGNFCHTIASFVSRVLQTSFVRAVTES